MYDTVIQDWCGGKGTVLAAGSNQEDLVAVPRQSGHRRQPSAGTCRAHLRLSASGGTMKILFTYLIVSDALGVVLCAVISWRLKLKWRGRPRA